MIITIGGLAGSGTTTAAKILSEKLQIPFLSAGEIFRQMAKEKGMDILEFGEYAEGNDEIDLEIDKRQAQLAKEKQNLIVEGRLSAYFVEADLKIWFVAPIDVRCKRISNREDKTVETVKNEIIARGKSEATRYQEIHGIDINNMEVYDLVINSHSFNPEGIANIILKVTEVITCQQ
jgi:cytidylate kinase